MKIDHVAHPCRDPRRTHSFYNGVLGLRLVQAYPGEKLMLVYELPGGGSLVFSTTGKQPSLQGDESNWDCEHVGVTVATRVEFEAWLQRLRKDHIEHRLVDDERIYFADPDGLVLEIEVESPMRANANAQKLLDRWVQEH